MLRRAVTRGRRTVDGLAAAEMVLPAVLAPIRLESMALQPPRVTERPREGPQEQEVAGGERRDLDPCIGRHD